MMTLTLPLKNSVLTVIEGLQILRTSLVQCLWNYQHNAVTLLIQVGISRVGNMLVNIRVLKFRKKLFKTSTCTKIN